MNRTLFAQAKPDAGASGNCENATGVAVDLRYNAPFAFRRCPSRHVRFVVTVGEVRMAPPREPGYLSP